MRRNLIIGFAKPLAAGSQESGTFFELKKIE